MKLSPKQFDELRQKNKLTLCFIGMSNTGKSYWSKKLAALGFEHLNCDDLIEQKLAPELKARGYSGIEDVSRWMGQPYDKRFAAHQQKYLDFEKEVIDRILAEIKSGREGNIAIDTTGSFVHLEPEVCLQLSRQALMIYIEASSAMKDGMFKLYIKKPKPVVFGDVFVPRTGESPHQTLRRCYPILLERRSSLYARYADATIPRETISKDMGTEKFISILKQSLA